jgi:hypothetical protein
MNALQRTLEPELLTEVQASDVLHLSVRTLQAWRGQGRGPYYVRAGRAVRYRRSDLLEWIRQQTVVTKTLKQDVSVNDMSAAHV